MKTVLRTIQIFFFPQAFREAAIDHLTKTTPGRDLGDLTRWRTDFDAQISKKRYGLLVSFLVVVTCIVAGYFVAIVSNQYYPFSVRTVRLIRVSALVVIAWAVFGRIGYETVTYGGKSLIEVTSARVFKQLYGIGIFLGTVGLFLDASRD